MAPADGLFVASQVGVALDDAFELELNVIAVTSAFIVRGVRARRDSNPQPSDR